MRVDVMVFSRYMRYYQLYHNPSFVYHYRFQVIIEVVQSTGKLNIMSNDCHSYFQLVLVN
jgi:hypothetical protein